MSARVLKAVAASLVAICVGAGHAHAGQRLEEFGGFSPAALPCEIEFDENGLLWAELVAANAMASIDTETGEVREYPLPTPGAMPGGMELGPDGGIWFPEVIGNQIVRLDPRDGSMEEFPLPWGNALGAETPYGYAASDDVTFGKDGALYFTLIGLNGIGRMDIETGEMTRYDIPTKPAGPAIIQPGPGNLLLFGMIFTNKVGTIDTTTKQIREYTVPGHTTQGVTLGPDGDIWYTSPLSQQIGRIDAETGDVEAFDLIALRKGSKLPITPGSPLPTPTTIRTGGDGNLYFGQGGLLFPSFGNKIGRYDPRTGDYEEIVTPSPASTPCDQNAQKPDELWTGLFTANKIGRIKLEPKPEYAYCRQLACPEGVPTGPPAQARSRPRRCRRTSTLRLPRRGGRVVRTRVIVGGRTVKRLGSRATRTRIRLHGRRRATVTVLIRQTLESGRVVEVRRRVRGCS